MKRILPLLLMVLLLTGCTPNTPASSQSGSASDAPPPPPSQSISSGSQSEELPPPDGPSWQSGYLELLNDLATEHGKITAAEPEQYTGLKYVRLLDFNGDGVRELVVLVNDTVQLYGYQNDEVVLLYEQATGPSYGQTDVSNVFHINAQSEFPCLALYHSQSEWGEEAITVVRLSEEGAVVTTELFASRPAVLDPGLEDFPAREYLDYFEVNGETVTLEVYDEVRGAALDDSLTVEVHFDLSPIPLSLLLRSLNSAVSGDGSYYLLPDADVRAYSQEELSRLTARELRLARNEIYARYGRRFDAPDLKAYFGEQGWYLPSYTAQQFDAISASLLNRWEQVNLSLILATERSGNYDQNAEDLTPEQALSIAEAYWNYRDGMLEPGTGFLMTLSADPATEIGSHRYYVFRLRALENNDHWATRELIYVDAQSGATSTTLSE